MQILLQIWLLRWWDLTSGIFSKKFRLYRWKTRAISVTVFVIAKLVLEHCPHNNYNLVMIADILYLSPCCCVLLSQRWKSNEDALNYRCWWFYTYSFYISHIAVKTFLWQSILLDFWISALIFFHFLSISELIFLHQFLGQFSWRCHLLLVSKFAKSTGHSKIAKRTSPSIIAHTICSTEMLNKHVSLSCI